MDSNRNEQIRVIALAVLRQADHIFVTEYVHPITGELYYRPLGGGVDFYETGEDAIRRELLEEIDADLTDVHYVGMMENIFTTEDSRGHQICLMYTATFTEAHRNTTDYIVEGQEGETPFKAMWKPISIFRTGSPSLYPNGLLDLLDNSV